MTIRYHPEARFELADAVTWYAAESVANATRFKDQFEAIVESIMKMPERFPPGDRSTRKARFRNYPYTVIFRHDAQGITVFAIAHHKRRPGYWHSRTH